MRFELEQDDEGVELHDLSPNDVKGMLIAVLVRNVYEADLRTPLQKRQLDGALNRVPKDFYDRVWSILEKTPYGIKVAGYLLPQVHTPILYYQWDKNIQITDTIIINVTIFSSLKLYLYLVHFKDNFFITVLLLQVYKN